MQTPTIRMRITAHELVRCTPLRLAFFLGLALLTGLHVLQQARGMNGFRDAQFLSAYERHALLAVTHFRQWPLWDPYNCGGVYGLAAPQTRYASPFFLLSLLFGVDAAASLLFVLLPALGMEGMYRYAQRWGALSVPAFLFAPLFPLCGWFAFAWHFGWVQFLSFCLVPWILVGLRGALRSEPKSAWLCAVAVAITIGFGGTYTLPLALVLCLFELVDAALPRLGLLWRRGRDAYTAAVRQRLRTIGRGLLITIPLVLGIAAYRLWPMIESLQATLRIMGGEPRMTYDALRKLLWVVATAGVGDAGHFYIAPVVALGVLALPWRGAGALWLGAALSFALAFGHASSHAPFALLRRLPIYDTLRYPERSLLLFALAASVLAARGASTVFALARRFGGGYGAAAALLLLAAVAAYGIALEGKNSKALASRVRLVPTPELREAAFRQSRGNRWLMSHFAPEGMGSLSCGEAYPLPMSTRLRGDLPTEEYLVSLSAGPPPNGRARRLSWSPNRIVVAVDSPAPVRLAINQNYHPGWSASVGELESWDGLLSVRLPAGSREVALSFRPRSGIGGMIASLIAFLGGTLFAFRTPRSQRARALSVSAGPIAVALLILVWREPPWQPPEPLTDDGEPVLLDSPPEDATPLHVRFKVPLTLEAARMPSAPIPKGVGASPIELFFRRTGPLSSSLGVFVHMIGPEDASGRADHPELSGRVYFAKMPLGKVVRDSFRLPFPLAASGEWEVRVGMWNMYGDGERIRIMYRGRAKVDAGAVVLGRFSIASPL